MMYKEFRVGDIFSIQTGSLVKASDLVDGHIPRISVKSDDNGIIGYFNTENVKDARHFENFITVNFFGNAFYHRGKASVEMKVHVLTIPGHNYTRETGLYIVTALNKIFHGRFTYGEQLSSSKLKSENYYISLPVNQIGEIDFEFMKKYIRELELARIRELETYLKVTGLTDYELTPAEKKFLAEYRRGGV